MGSLKELLLALGIPGVFLITALDSSGIPMVGGPDAVIMLVSWQRPAMTPVIAIAAAMGSTIGCYLLYLIGHKGGDLALGRFDKEKQERVKNRLRRNDCLAIFVAVIGPPPFPTKIFILTAGVIYMSWKRFVLTVFAGRFLRYLGEGYLGARFGDQAADVLLSYYPTIGVVLLVVVVTILVIRHWQNEKPS
jgi:membrane protein YqaA with SNARE-associated domain